LPLVDLGELQLAGIDILLNLDHSAIECQLLFLVRRENPLNEIHFGLGSVRISSLSNVIDVRQTAFLRSSVLIDLVLQLPITRGCAVHFTAQSLD